MLWLWTDQAFPLLASNQQILRLAIVALWHLTVVLSSVARRLTFRVLVFIDARS